MTQDEFNELLPTIPRSEQQAFQKWYIQYQDVIGWEDFRARGFKHVAEVVQAFQNHIEQEDGKTKQLNLFAQVPTQLSRTSPFFPVKTRGVEGRLIHGEDFKVENAWGSIALFGPQLSIHDESVLLALLVMSKKRNSLQIETTYSELCSAMQVSRGTAKYKAIRESLVRLAKTTVDTTLKERDGEKLKDVRQLTGAMLNVVEQDFKTKNIQVEINKYFKGLYGEGLMTSLDIKKRAALRGDVSKALYRFLETHNPNPTGRPGFGVVTLAAAINLNLENPLIEIRRQLRTALKELYKHGHVKKGWRITKDDVVVIPR